MEGKESRIFRSSDRTKIEKEKVKTVLDWPIFKEIKNVQKFLRLTNYYRHVTNFIQLVSPQPVDQFSQTKLLCKAPNEGYLHIYRMYKSNNKQPRYQAISNCKIFVGYYLMNGWTDSHD